MASITVALLGALVVPARPDDADRVRKQVEKVQDAKASNRLKAVRQLRKLGGAAVPAVPQLLRVAQDPDIQVRAEAEAALGELQAALVDVARTHADADVRALAVARIREDAALEAVARSAPPDTARAALERLDDPAVLAEVARAGGQAVREAAIARIADPARLGELLREADPELSAAATARILALAAQSPPEARTGVLSQIEDRDALLSLARKGPVESALLLAESLDDVDVLAAAAAHNDPKVAGTALARSRDPRVIEAGAAHPDETVRLLALRRVSDVKRIAAAAKGDASARVRIAMASRLTGTATLGQLSRSDANPTVRRLAAFLVAQPERGKKPVVALELRKEDKFLALVRRRTPALLDQRALLFECAPELECALFSSRATVEVSVTDSTQCFDKFYIAGPCANPGKDVRFAYDFLREGESIGRHTFSGRTPSSVEYKVTTYGGVALAEMGPSGVDVWRDTEKAVLAAAAQWNLSERLTLDRFVVW
jgi:hypothetical protein